MTPPRFIAPGATLGVLGGGQLGRMFVHAAQQMGYLTVVLEPDVDSPAGRTAHYHLPVNYADAAGLAALGQQANAITTEFENVPAQALQQLAQHCVVAPSSQAISTCQDRAAEKAHLMACGVPTAPYVLIETAQQLVKIQGQLLPGILKTNRMGYDGKGQISVNTAADLAQGWQQLGQVPCVLEKRLSLAQELSVIVARSAAGQVVHFPVQQNLHINGILAVTQVPAPNVTAPLQQQAITAAEKIATQLHYVGVLCVEFFVLTDGSLVANEMAPRPHNSGHYTLDACDVSQFELQVRTLTGAPITPPRLHSPAVMLNLLGDLWFNQNQQELTPPWAAVLALPGAHLHLYGKTQARMGRKMGHLTITATTPEEARKVAKQAAALLGLNHVA
jgi:5-(carboxyamino)imidazole ribonucleotide synthase